MGSLKHCIITGLLTLVCLSSQAMGDSGYLQVSENGRYLARDDGQSFFWLGDTAWELFHRLDRKDIDYYLHDRHEKGFTVIQAVILSELYGLTEPNPEGNLPLIDLDPTQPNEAYFELIDHVVEKAASYGMHMALLPTWGSHVEDKSQFESKNLFTPETARQYGEFLGKRYRDQWNIIWILGGDRPAEQHLDVWDAMAAGLENGDGGKHLITYHPGGQQSSSMWLHERDWLDFNMVQTGHHRSSDNVYDSVFSDYQLHPVKPVINGEPAYEDMGQWFNGANPRWNAYEIRKLAYWSVFAGAFGHTYGNNNIWQMTKKGQKSVLWSETPWDVALNHPGAGKLKHLRSLMESRPYRNGIPAQELLQIENPTYASDHVRVTRDGSPDQKDASYIMAYLPLMKGITLDTSVVPSDKIQVWFYSASTGRTFDRGIQDNSGIYKQYQWNLFMREVHAADYGPDWVIVIDDPGKGYPAPGYIGQ